MIFTGSDKSIYFKDKAVNLSDTELRAYNVRTQDKFWERKNAHQIFHSCELPYLELTWLKNCCQESSECLSAENKPPNSQNCWALGQQYTSSKVDDFQSSSRLQFRAGPSLYGASSKIEIIVITYALGGPLVATGALSSRLVRLCLGPALLQLMHEATNTFTNNINSNYFFNVKMFRQGEWKESHAEDVNNKSSLIRSPREQKQGFQTGKNITKYWKF